MTTRLWPLVFLAACAQEDPEHKRLLEELESHSPLVRCSAALALWEKTGEVEPGLSALLDHAASENQQEHAAAARHLPRAKGVPRQVMLEAAANEDARAGLAVVGAIGPAAKELEPFVRAHLDAQQAVLRTTAALALFRITGEAREPLERLVKELKATDILYLRRTIANMLLEIGEQHGDELERALEDNPEIYAGLLELMGDRDG